MLQENTNKLRLISGYKLAMPQRLFQLKDNVIGVLERQLCPFYVTGDKYNLSYVHYPITLGTIPLLLIHMLFSQLVLLPTPGS